MNSMRRASSFDARTALRILLGALFAFLTALMLFPQTAHAKDYSISKLDTEADIASDEGVLYVDEARTFDFKGTYYRTWWEPDEWGDSGRLFIIGVSVQDENGTIEELPQVDMRPQWREDVHPSIDCWAWDSEYGRLYTFHKATDTKTTVTYHYAVVDFLTVYDDVAYLYWKHVGSHWDVATHDITLTLHVPVPANTDARDYVKVWGHGPLEGTENIDADGTVTLKTPKVNSGRFAEIRLVFPAEWITNTQGAKVVAGNGLPAIEAQESVWEEQAQNIRMATRILIVAYIVLLIVVVVAPIAYRSITGRIKPDFTGEYWSDEPAKGIHPLVVMCSENEGSRPKSQDFYKELMHLSAAGYIDIEPLETKWGAGKKKDKPDFKLIMNTHKLAEPIDPIDAAALKYIFGPQTFQTLTPESQRVYQQYSNIVPQTTAQAELLDKMLNPWKDAVKIKTDAMKLVLPKRPPMLQALFIAPIVSGVALYGLAIALLALTGDMFWGGHAICSDCRRNRIDLDDGVKVNYNKFPHALRKVTSLSEWE